MFLITSELSSPVTLYINQILLSIFLAIFDNLIALSVLSYVYLMHYMYNLWQTYTFILMPKLFHLSRQISIATIVKRRQQTILIMFLPIFLLYL